MPGSYPDLANLRSRYSHRPGSGGIPRQRELPQGRPLNFAIGHLQQLQEACNARQEAQIPC